MTPCSNSQWIKTPCSKTSGSTTISMQCRSPSAPWRFQGRLKQRRAKLPKVQYVDQRAWKPEATKVASEGASVGRGKDVRGATGPATSSPRHRAGESELRRHCESAA